MAPASPRRFLPRRLSVAGVFALTALVAGCGMDADGRGSGPASTVAAPATAQPGSATAEDPTPEEPAPAEPTSEPRPAQSDTAVADRTLDREIVIAATGDVHGEAPIAGVLASGGNPLGGVTGVFAEADIVVVNLETAVGTRGSPADKQYTFQADPALMTALAEAGVNVVSLANNHALDYGVEALRETIALARDAGLAVVGAGEDIDEAYAPALFEVAGRTVAVLGLSRVLPVPEWAAASSRPGMASAYDHDAAAAAVERAAVVADHVVVSVHWGEENRDCANVDQVRIAHRLIDAGADVVAGHHPHMLQGVHEIDDSVAAYSLGNFVWYARSPATRQTAVLLATLGPGGLVHHRIVPALIDEHGGPQVVHGADAEDILEAVRLRSPGGGTCPAAVWDRP